MGRLSKLKSLPVFHVTMAGDVRFPAEVILSLVTEGHMVT